MNRERSFQDAAGLAGSRDLPLAREVSGRASLALRLQRASGKQLSNRKRERLRRRAKLSVDLLDTKPGVLGDEGEDRIGEVREILRSPLETSTARTGATSNLAAERACERLDRGAARQIADLRHEAVDKTFDIGLKICHLAVRVDHKQRQRNEFSGDIDARSLFSR